MLMFSNTWLEMHHTGCSFTLQIAMRYIVILNIPRLSGLRYVYGENDGKSQFFRGMEPNIKFILASKCNTRNSGKALL